jgi:cytochrome c biogenesis protein CcmG/thiol:disulfide interchange protein DsbE
VAKTRFGERISRLARLRVAWAAGSLAVSMLALAACGGAGDGGSQTGGHPDYGPALAGSPPPLARLHEQAGRLLPGELPAFERRLADLRGHPVVVNKWASWCGPCREEFPWFQRLSARLGRGIAFVGVDSRDSAAAARTFLEEFPVPYPSYSDPDQEIARAIGAGVGFPATAFYDSGGRLAYTRQGQYASESDLAADIRRYAR